MPTITLNSLTTGFFGAYRQRVEQNGRKASLEQARQESRIKDFSDPQTKRVTWRQLSDSEVAFSEDAQNFIEETARTKKEMLAEQKASVSQKENKDINPFSRATGTDLYPQFLVFSEYLYNNGFYDAMSDDEVKEKEGLLQEITSPMEKFGCKLEDVTIALSDGRTTQVKGFDINKALTADGAEVAFQSSVKALQYYADKFVPEEMREGFHRLIDQYVGYNRSRVDHYIAFREERDKEAGDMPTPQVGPRTKEDSERYAREEADRKLARVTHTEKEKDQHDMECRAWLSMLTRPDADIGTVFMNLRKSMIQYAAGYSGDQNVLNRTKQKLSTGFEQMMSCWNRLIKTKP